MIKPFPDGYYKTGDFDYEESKYMKFLKEDPRCPYAEGSGKLFEYKDDESGNNEYTLYPRWPCDYKPNAVNDATRGDVSMLNHYHDWCWNTWGWRIAPGVAMHNSFNFHMWVKWTGNQIPWGGMWLRRRWTSQEWYDCPRGEWCELNVAVEDFDYGYYSNYYHSSWSTAAYFEVYGMSWFNAEFTYDQDSIYGCAYQKDDVLSGLV